MNFFSRPAFRCLLIILLFGLAHPLFSSKDTELQEMNALTYNHNQDIPLSLGMTSTSEVIFIDWDSDGDQDILTTGNYSFGLIENIGTSKKPRFANTFNKTNLLLEDKRIGRFFTIIRQPGIENYPERKVSILCFDRHTYTKEVGKVDLQLRMFIPSKDDGKVNWEIVPAYGEDGQEIEMFADTWICPTIDAGDLNGDGKEDIIIGTSHPSKQFKSINVKDGFNNPPESYNPYSSRLYIMYNISDSNSDRLTFSDPVTVEADGEPVTAFAYIYQRLIDIDNDGLLDLVVGQSKPGLKWYRNTGTKEQPKFTSAGYICKQADKPIKTIFAIRPFFGDINGDNRPEMMTSTYFGCMSNLVRYDLENSDSNNLSRGWEKQGPLQMAGSKNTPVTAQGIATMDPIDWDNDGDLDIVLGSEPAAPAVLINKGSNSKPVWDPPRRLQFVDGSPVEYYSIEVGRGSVWGPGEHYMERCQPRMADWDGDGVVDILTGSMGLRQLWLRGRVIDGELRFERPVAFEVKGDPIDAAHRVQPAVIDYNNDGHLDLIALDSNNVVCLWKGNGTKEVSKPERINNHKGNPLQLSEEILTTNSGRKAIEAVDWNMDGITDLVTYESFVWPAGIKLYCGTEKSLQFKEPVKLHKRHSYHTGGIGLSDWNGDGYLDIFTGGDTKQLKSDFEVPGQLFIISGSQLPVPSTKRAGCQYQSSVTNKH